MTDMRVPDYQTPDQVLERTRALFGLADHHLLLAMAPEHRDKTSHLDTEDYERLADLLFAGVAAGAELAKALLLQEEITQALKAEEELRHAITGSRDGS